MARLGARVRRELATVDWARTVTVGVGTYLLAVLCSMVLVLVSMSLTGTGIGSTPAEIVAALFEDLTTLEAVVGYGVDGLHRAHLGVAGSLYLLGETAGLLSSVWALLPIVLLSLSGALLGYGMAEPSLAGALARAVSVAAPYLVLTVGAELWLLSTYPVLVDGLPEVTTVAVVCGVIYPLLFATLGSLLAARLSN